MANAITPIIVYEAGDVRLFETLREAELKLEAPEVEDGIFTIFDSRGLILIPRVDPDGNRVHIEESCPAEYRADELTSVLRDLHSRTDEALTQRTQPEILHMKLDELVSLLKDVQRRGPRRRTLWPWSRKA